MRSAKVLTLNFDQLRQLQAAMVVHSTDRIVELSTEGTAKKREFLGTVEKLDASIAGASLHEPPMEMPPLDDCNEPDENPCLNCLASGCEPCCGSCDLYLNNEHTWTPVVPCPETFGSDDDLPF
jgi:hypothetical protein